MKKLITHNLLLKILSVAFAFILWLVVVNINDPDITKTIRSIEISILNEDAITGQGLGQVYTIKENKSASIVVKGPRSKVDKLDRNEIKATVDFSEVSSVGAVPINIVSLPEGVTLQSKITENMKITVEPLKSQRFPVTIETTGTPADGYVVGDTEVSPNVVSIKAPESLMEQIKHVKVLVDVDGMSTDITRKRIPLVLIDGNGKEIEYAENEHITLSAAYLLAGADILRYHAVPIQAAATGEVADGYRFTGIEFSHNSVTLKGTRDVMAGVSSVVIPETEEALDLTGLTRDKEVMLDLLPYLPEGTTCLNEVERYVTIKLKVEELSRRNVHISTDSLTVLRAPADAEISYTVTPDSMAELEGLSADLAQVTVNALNPTIDLGGRGAGTYNLAVEITVPDQITVIRQAYITVTITEIREEEPSEAESPADIEAGVGENFGGGETQPHSSVAETESGTGDAEEETTIPVMIKPADNEITQHHTQPDTTPEETSEQETPQDDEEELTEPAST